MCKYKKTNVHYVCVKKRWHKCSDMRVGTQFILCNNYFELLFRSEQATENYIQKIMIRKKNDDKNE